MPMDPQGQGAPSPDQGQQGQQGQQDQQQGQQPGQQPGDVSQLVVTVGQGLMQLLDQVSSMPEAQKGLAPIVQMFHEWVDEMGEPEGQESPEKDTGTVDPMAGAAKVQQAY